jgi:hypothetical protein
LDDIESLHALRRDRRQLGDAAADRPNPSFTSAALADRFAHQIIDPDRRAAEAAA